MMSMISKKSAIPLLLKWLALSAEPRMFAIAYQSVPIPDVNKMAEYHVMNHKWRIL